MHIRNNMHRSRQAFLCREAKAHELQCQLEFLTLLMRWLRDLDTIGRALSALLREAASDRKTNVRQKGNRY